MLRRRPVGELSPGDLELVTERPRPLGAGSVRIRNRYLSIDPTQRIWMSERPQYLPPMRIGDTVRGTTLGIVEESADETLPVGAWASLLLGGWETETVVPARRARRVDRIPGIPASAHLSVLGGTGVTAWLGIAQTAAVQEGETVVVSAAAGAVGSIAGQLARLRGARVIGIAGGPAKCAWLVDELGFDGAIDHRAGDIGSALDRLCPDGVDVQFENVGGGIMREVFARLRAHGRLVVCGLIADYNDEATSSVIDLGSVLMRRLRVEGLLLGDHLARRAEAVAELAPLAASGAIAWRDHIVTGLEHAPEALALLFSGANIGKVVVEVTSAGETEGVR